MTRRQFLRNTGLGLSSALLLPSGLEGCISPLEPYPAPPARNDYRMAFVVVKPNVLDSCFPYDHTVKMAKLVAENFPSKFSSATNGRVTVDVDPKVYEVVMDSNYITGTNNDFCAPVEGFNRKYNSKDDFDFVTLFFGFDSGLGKGHISIFNTSERIVNNSNPLVSRDIESRRIIGINSLDSISYLQCTPHNNSLTLLSEIYIADLFHEISHQWSAFFQRNLVTSRKSGDKGHFNGRLNNFADTLNVGEYIHLQDDNNSSEVFWEPLGNGKYMLHRPENINYNYKTDILRERPYSELTLWAMNALNLDELHDENYLLLDQNFINSKLYYILPPDRTIATGRIVSSREIILDYLINGNNGLFN